MNQPFAHWVFDLDGTLIDSLQHYNICLRRIFSEMEIKASEEDFKRSLNYFDPRDFFATLAMTPQQSEHACQRLVALNIEHAHEIPAFENIGDLLRFLHSKKVHMSVWTGRDFHSAKKILDHLGFSKYLQHCVGRTCTPRTKPHPDGLHKILTDSAHRAEDLVMIGDHAYDMLGAKAANIKAVSVEWRGVLHPEARTHSDLHFDRIDHFHAWAEKLYS